MITIPLSGTIRGLVGKAPFQFNPSNPSLGLPQFTNGSSGPLADIGGGIYGLTSIYGSISPWQNNGEYNDAMVQLAGSVVGSFGIYDYDTSLANPAEFNPVLNTGSGYGGKYAGQASAFNRYNYTLQQSGATGPIIRYRCPFPSLIFENLKGTFRVNQTAYYGAPYSVTGSGFIQPVNGFVAIDEATRLEKAFGICIFGITGGSGGSPALLSGMYFFPDEGCGSNTLNANGGKYPPQLIEKSETSQAAVTLGFGSVTGMYNGCVNPTTGAAIFNCQNAAGGNPPYNFGGGPTQGFFTTPSVYFSPDVVAGVYTGSITVNATQLSDPTDNAALTGGLGANQYKAVMTPSGFFLLYVPALPYYLLIAGDLSAYYRVILSGNTAAAQDAVSNGGHGVGFGMDLNGNLWFGGSAAFIPIMYSTLGLNFELVLQEFPQFSSAAMGCRVMGGMAQAVWEG